jgi:hypothetical protein
MNKRAVVLGISLGLGVLAAFLNWLYLMEKGKAVASESFLGIAPGMEVRQGEVFAERHFTPVVIPKNHVGSLTEFAVKWDARDSVVNLPANRTYRSGELILRKGIDSDLDSPPQELELRSPDERAMWIPVDTRTFVPSLVMPGDYVSFLVGGGTAEFEEDDPDSDGPPLPRGTPTPAGSGGQVETVGPFRVLSLGNRLGSAEVMRAAGLSQQQENVMTISVREAGGQLDPKAKKLWGLLRSNGFREVGVLLHPRQP